MPISKSHAQIITTVVGNGKVPMAQIQARFKATWGGDVCVDGAGNLFVADYGHHRIQKVTPSGDITTVAGTGLQGFGGDGGLATQAQFNRPMGIDVDDKGNLFICDMNNNRVRKVDTRGMITTVAGTGLSGYSGDGELATQAQLNRPQDVVIDGAGNLFIVDTGNHCVRKVDVSGVVTTVAGTGLSGYSGDEGLATQVQLNTPRSVAVDEIGNLFIADQKNNCIRKVDTLGVMTTIVGTSFPGNGGDGGPAIQAQLNRPRGIAVDGVGHLYIADHFNMCVRKVDISGVITTVAGTGSPGYSGDGGPAIQAQIRRPISVCVDAHDNVYMLDFNNVVRKIDSFGLITTIAGHGKVGDAEEGGSALLALAGGEHSFGDVAVDGVGDLFITDGLNHSIRKVDASGRMTTVAGTGVPGFGGDGGLATMAQLHNPLGVFLDDVGNVFVADTQNHRIRKIDTLGVMTTVAGTGTPGYGGDGGDAKKAQLNNPRGVFVDTKGNVFIADDRNHRIRKIDTLGVITTVAGTGFQGYSGDGGLATQAQLKRPFDIYGDVSGHLFVADFSNSSIRKIDTFGVMTTVAGTGKQGYSGDGSVATKAKLLGPSGIFLDVSGNLFFAEYRGHRIRKVNASGVITTVAGIGKPGYSGDGDVSTQAQLNRPSAVVGDGAGNLFVRDYGNYRVRKISGHNGAYAIRHYGTDHYLFEQDRVYGVRASDTLQPEGLEFVWNVRYQGGVVSIQNAQTRKFLQVGQNRVDVTNRTKITADAFVLKDNGDGIFAIVPEQYDDRGLVSQANGRVTFGALTEDLKSGQWELVRVGPVQNRRFNTAKETGFDQDPKVLNGKQVLLGVDGTLQEQGDTYQSGFRWLYAHKGWVTASSEGMAYQNTQVFTLEYVGTWESILDAQNDYAKQCKILEMDAPVFVLKAGDGSYLQAEGVTTQLNYNTGLPEPTRVHLTTGNTSGIYPNYPAGTSDRNKAALFGIGTKKYENGEWIADGHLRLHAITHQWNQPPSLFSSLLNQNVALPLWGIVTPISLYTLQALHNLQTSNPWPMDYPLPEDHWVAAYALGVVLPLKADPNAKVRFVNAVEKERQTNMVLGMTTGWQYWFHAHSGAELKLFVLDRSTQGEDREKVALKRE